MMPIKHIQKHQQKLRQNNPDFYTPGGIHVFFKEAMVDTSVDMEKVVARVENILPAHLLAEVEMIILGWFDEFEERSINAFYRDGALYLSNLQSDENDTCDDVIHEIAHSLEAPYGYEIYGDQKLKDEFLRKRIHLHDILWASSYRIPKNLFLNPEYDKDFDMALYKKIGYDRLFNLTKGLFITPYAATSLREYFSTGFTDFYTQSDHGYLKKVSPVLYQKIFLLQDPESLDNS